MELGQEGVLPAIYGFWLDSFGNPLPGLELAQLPFATPEVVVSQLSCQLLGFAK